MTKQELVDICSERINKLSVKLENPPVEYSFYNDFVKDYNYKTISGLLKIPSVDFAAALLYPDIEDKTLNEILDDVLSFRCVLEDLSSDELKTMNEIFRGFVHMDKGDKLEDIFKDTNVRRAAKDAKDYLNDYRVDEEEKQLLDKVHTVMNKLILNNRKYGWDILYLIHYYRDNTVVISNIISITSAFKYIKEGKEENLDFNSRDFKERYNTKDMMYICSAITECRRHINEEYRKIESNLRHRLNIYKKFLKDIEKAFESDEIKNYELIIHDVEDDILKLEFLRLVYQHNKIKYDEIDAVHEKLTRNSLVNYLTVLKSNGIKKDDVDLSKITRNSCEDLDKMIKILNGIVGDKKIIIRIIESSDLMNVNYFKELKSKNVLSTNAFSKYHDIFDINSIHRKILDKNIEIINSYKVDFTLFSKHPDILIENSNLGDNLEILKTYKLLDSLKYSKKFSFLKKNNLSSLIDKIIELGYENLLVENLELLNEDNWDRIYVLKSMGVKPEDNKELIKYLRDDKFFIPNDRLNIYIEDTSEYYSDLDYGNININEFIKNNEVTSRSLCINGVIISKNRVLRNIDNGNKLFKAIITGSILNMNEVESIKEDLKNKVYKISE